MIRLFTVDAARGARARKLDGEPTDMFLSDAAAPRDAFRRAPILVASLEIHPAVDAGRVEAQYVVERTQRLDQFAPRHLVDRIKTGDRGPDHRLARPRIQIVVVQRGVHRFEQRELEQWLDGPQFGQTQCLACVRSGQVSTEHAPIEWRRILPFGHRIFDEPFNKVARHRVDPRRRPRPNPPAAGPGRHDSATLSRIGNLCVEKR